MSFPSILKIDLFVALLLELIVSTLETSASSIFEKFFQIGAAAYFARHPLGTYKVAVLYMLSKVFSLASGGVTDSQRISLIFVQPSYLLLVDYQCYTL